MGHGREGKSWPNNLSADERIQQAQQKLEKIIDRVILGIAVNKSNKALMGEHIWKQIPDSRGANCYNNLVASQLKYEALLLATIWDIGQDPHSLPSVRTLVDRKSVREKLEKCAKSQYPADDPEGQLTDYYKRRNQEEAELFEKRFSCAIEVEKTFRDDPHFQKLLDYRNYEISHSSSNAPYKFDRNNIPMADKLWDKTIECVDNFNSAIRLSDFDWNGSKNIAVDSATEFWGSVSFKFSSR
jgi:hypothetical protein